METFFTIAAWFGALQIISMYLLLSWGYIKPNKTYQFFNLTGAAFLCYSCIVGQTWQAAIVEGVWVLIASISLIRLFIKECQIKKENKSKLQNGLARSRK